MDTETNIGLYKKGLKGGDVPRRAPVGGSVSDSAMIDWMEATGNGLWMNPSTLLWECDDGSDREGFQAIREAVQSTMKQNAPVHRPVEANGENDG